MKTLLVRVDAQCAVPHTNALSKVLASFVGDNHQHVLYEYVIYRTLQQLLLAGAIVLNGTDITNDYKKRF
jgi:hypothetical protein